MATWKHLDVVQGGDSGICRRRRHGIHGPATRSQAGMLLVADLFELEYDRAEGAFTGLPNTIGAACLAGTGKAPPA